MDIRQPDGKSSSLFGDPYDSLWGISNEID